MGINGRLAGVGVSVEHEGTVYTLGPITGVVKGRFEDWMFRRAAINIERQRKLTVSEDGLPPVVSLERFAEIKAEHDHNILCDGYTWGGESWQKFFRSPPGIIHFVFLCLQPNHADATEETAAMLVDENPEHVSDAIRTLLQRPNLPGRQKTTADNFKPGVYELPKSGSGLSSSTVQA